MANVVQDGIRSVHRGINSPSKTPPPLFLHSLFPLNLQPVQAPLFRQFPPIYYCFVNPPKNLVFQ